MRERMRLVWVVLLPVLALVIVGELSFDRPLRRVEVFRFEETTASLVVRITGESVSSVASEGGSRLELRVPSGVELLRRDGTSSLETLALLFEVFAAEPRMLRNVVLGGEKGSTVLAPLLDSTAIEYRCCGEQSAIVIEVGPTLIVLDDVTDPVLTFEIPPSSCVYDSPKVFCRFATLRSGGPIVVEGGSILLSDFGGLDLRGAVFLNVDLRGSSFAGADLRGALFRNVNLTDVDWIGADLDQVIFRRFQFRDKFFGRP